MKLGKGNIVAQRRRRKDRYRGCPVCGIRGAQCTECDRGKELVALHGRDRLVLVVDGSFVEATGEGPGHGGAGLVLVDEEIDEIVASRACGFAAEGSSDAELHAVIRAARWAPGVAIYTDSRDLPAKVQSFNPRLSVHYLVPNDRGEAYAMAHRLSVVGRCREAPNTVPAVGIDYAASRSELSRAQRKARGVELLLERARMEPNFDGDFIALADRLGWTSGKHWRDNPSIRIAADRWASLVKKA